MGRKPKRLDGVLACYGKARPGEAWGPSQEGQNLSCFAEAAEVLKGGDMDHGILNIPLAKRGNIDAQIDCYKADQKRAAAKQRKADAAILAGQRALAKAAVAAMPDERAAELMQRTGLTRKQIDKKLNSIAHWTPDRILRGI